MINPTMIQLARESRGWTQGDLAKAIGVTQAAISKYEAGLLPVPRHHAEAIAERLRYTVELIEQQEPMIAVGGDFLYRRKVSVSAKVRRRVEAEANIRKLQVRRLLHNVRVDAPPDFPAIQPEEKGGRIERVAQEVRRAWRIPDGPIQNMTRLLENHGAIVFLVDFGSNEIDGTNLRHPGVPPLLFMNKNVPGERHRFNLAHELGHVVMHYHTTTGDAEQEAHTFAREFLMPRSDVRTDLKNLNLSSAARLKQVWGVSMQCLIVHARKLRKITESKYRRLFTEMNARGPRTIEPLPLPFEQPEVFESMMRVHREELGWTDDELGRFLFTDQLGPLDPPVENKLRLTGSLFDSN